MAYVNPISQIQRLRERSEVICIGVHFVAGPRLRRPPMSAPVVRDAAIAVSSKKHHLRVPRVGGQRPAVTEDDRLPGAPVLKVDLRPVFPRDRAPGSFSDSRHDVFLSTTQPSLRATRLPG